jgi:transcriptional regulator with XRE-family HTH domain
VKLAQLHADLRAAIREAISSRSTSQQRLARATFLSQGYISAVLSGAKQARPVVIDEITEAAGVSFEASISSAAHPPQPAMPAPPQPVSVRHERYCTCPTCRHKRQARKATQ